MKTRHAMTYVIELDGVNYCLEGDRARQVDDLTAVAGEKWLVTNFQEAITRRMVVDGPPPYAELLVRRKMQESGEFEEPVHIITHWKAKRGKNATDILFTAMPTRVADYYFQDLRRQADLTLVVPVYALMVALLRHSDRKGPQAVVLRHDRFAEVLVADGRRVFSANRCVAFDTGVEQIRALWETIFSDLDAAEKEHRIEVSQVLCLNWLDTEPEPMAVASRERRLVPVSPVELMVDGAPRQVSWPAALARLRVGLSASPRLDKILYLCRRLAPACNLALLLSALLLAAGMLVFEERIQETRADLLDVNQQVRRLAASPPGLSLPAGFSEMVAFVSRMDRQRHLPAYGQVLADLTRSGFEALTVEQLNLEYAGDAVAVTLFATIEAPFEQARSGFQKMIRQLEATGYTIVEHRFETRINTSSAVLKLKRAAA